MTEKLLVRNVKNAFGISNGLWTSQLNGVSI